MSRRHILNVKSHLEHEVRSIEDMLRRNSMHINGGISLPPIDVENLNELWFIAECILRRHAAKKTRKDVYVSKADGGQS